MSARRSRALALLVFVLASACAPERTPAERLALAERYLEKGEKRSALLELRNVLKGDLDNVRARVLMGRLLVAMRDPAMAQANLEKATALGAPPTEVAVPLMQALLLQAHFAQAVETGGRFLGKDPALNAVVQDLRSQAQFALGDTVAAEQAARDALKEMPDYPPALTSLAHLDLRRGNLESAATLATRATNGDPRLASAWVIRGLVASRQRKYTDAEAAFRRAIELDPRGEDITNVAARSYSGLIDVQLAQGMTEEAGATVVAAQKVLANAPLVELYRARVAFETGDLKAARNAIQAYRVGNKSDKASLLLEGAIESALGSHARAGTLLTAFLAEYPDNVAARQLLAATNLRLDDPQGALKLLRESLTAGAADSTALSLAATANLSLGRSNAAIALLETALKSAPQATGLAEQLAYARLSARDATGALAALEQIADSSTNSVGAADLLRLQAFVDNGDQQRARDWLRTALAREPDDWRLQRLAGSVYLHMRDAEGAGPYFRRALELKPGDGQSLLGLARVALTLGRVDEAIQWVSRAGGKAAPVATIEFTLGLLQRTKGNDELAELAFGRARDAAPTWELPRLALVQIYADRGDDKRAAEELANARAALPLSAAVANALGIASLRANESADALRFFKEASELAPGESEPVANLARAQLKAGKAAQAQATLERALERRENNFAAAAMLALLHAQGGRMSTALQIARRQQEIPGNKYAAYALEGDLQVLAGEVSAGLAAYDKAHKGGFPAALAVKIFRGRQALRDRDAPQILEDYLRNDEGNTVVREVLADAYYRAGKSTEARAQYERLTSHSSRNAAVWNNLAILYLDAGDAERAVATAQEALKLAPQSLPVADTLGWATLGLGHTDEALTHLQRAAAGLPDSPTAQYHYAVALARAGRRQAARSVLEALARLPSAYPERAEATTLLTSLRNASG